MPACTIVPVHPQSLRSCFMTFSKSSVGLDLSDENVVGLRCPQIKFLPKELPYIRSFAKTIYIVF